MIGEGIGRCFESRGGWRVSKVCPCLWTGKEIRTKTKRNKMKRSKRTGSNQRRKLTIDGRQGGEVQRTHARKRTENLCISAVWGVTGGRANPHVRIPPANLLAHGDRWDCGFENLAYNIRD